MSGRTVSGERRLALYFDEETARMKTLDFKSENDLLYIGFRNDVAKENVVLVLPYKHHKKMYEIYQSATKEFNIFYDAQNKKRALIRKLQAELNEEYKQEAKIVMLNEFNKVTEYFV